MPLMFALAVAVGVAVTIVIQITLLPAPPAVVAPIETPPDAGSTTYTKSLVIPYDASAVYPTLAGLGKLQISVNTTGWYYLQDDSVLTVVRRSTGNAAFTLSSGSYVYVREINDTHAFVLYGARITGVVAQKVQVGTTGWIIYHPVVTDYDADTLNTIRNVMSSLGFSYVYVFQPKPDYVTYDPNTKTFNVYFDYVSNSGDVTSKYTYYANTTSFTPIPTDSPVTVSGIERISTENYVLFSVWAFLYYPTPSDVNSAITISPTE
jgi:hypothetical protein